MIAKITNISSFHAVLTYVVNKSIENDIEGEIEIESASVRLGGKMFSNTIPTMTNEFNSIRNKLKHPGKHLSMSLPRGESLSDEDWLRAVELALKETGYHNNQWVCYRHDDSLHQHVHVVINRKDFNGKTVKDSYEKLKFMHAMREVEYLLDLEHGLHKRKKNTVKMGTYEYLMNQEGKIPDKVELNSKIKMALSSSESWEEFPNKLKELGVVWDPRINKHGRETGARFTYKDKTYSGSKVGYTINALEQIFIEKLQNKEQDLNINEIKKVKKQITVEEFVDRCYTNNTPEKLVKWINNRSTSKKDQIQVKRSFDHIIKNGLKLKNNEGIEDLQKAYRAHLNRVKVAKEKQEKQEALKRAKGEMIKEVFSSQRTIFKKGELLSQYRQLQNFDKELAIEYAGLLLGIDKQGRKLGFISQSKINLTQIHFQISLPPEEYKRDILPLYQKSKSQELTYKKERLSEDPKTIQFYLTGLVDSNNLNDTSVRKVVECFEEEVLQQIDMSKFNPEQANIIKKAINEKEFTIQDAAEHIQSRDADKKRGMDI